MSTPAYLKYGLDFRNLIWVAAAVAVTIVAIFIENEWALRTIHVIASALWTGIDIFVGFVIGPLLRRLDPATRRSVMLRLSPKTIFIMPALAIVSPMAGWFLAVQTGYLELSFPEIWWLIAALCITTAMAFQGLFLILTANFRTFVELSKENPDVEKVAKITKRFFYNVALQGIFQVTIIVIMVRFSVGL